MASDPAPSTRGVVVAAVWRRSGSGKSRRVGRRAALPSRSLRGTRSSVATARNITLTVDEEILVEARVLAAQEGLSVSGLLRRELVNLVERQRGYTKAQESALRRLKRGQSLGMGKPLTREEVHEREKLR